MPTFSTLPIAEARARSATGKRAMLLKRRRRCIAGSVRQRRRWGSDWSSGGPLKPSTSGRRMVGSAECLARTPSNRAVPGRFRAFLGGAKLVARAPRTTVLRWTQNT